MAASQAVLHRSPQKTRCLKQDDLITIGLSQTEGKAIIQDYVNRMYNQFVEIRIQKKRRMLNYPSSELVTKLVTFT
ncbi:MAG: hypothetical protein DLM72_01735 [Candidatus Nitrosopolaris wilkensis]|nr:MAG: hypothetical protein DLM72_01735 [Candidatus Nitrosopolaris wilkensis]